MIAIGRFLLLVAVLLVPAVSAAAQETLPRWLRAVEEPRKPEVGSSPESLRLELALRRYEAPERPGGEVTLVGVVHIGDAAYYEALATLLAEYDKVLFESVAPAGANGVHGSDDSERAARTREAMRFIGVVLERHLARTSTMPPSLDALAEASGELDSRLPGWVRTASRDGWSTPLLLEVLPPEEVPEDAPPSRVRWRLVSYGADRMPAGEGNAEDIVLSEQDAELLPRPSGNSIQAEVADALGLSFQLHALDYARDGWVLADMTEPELRAAARERGVDVGPLMDGLAGSGLPARLGRMILTLLRVADFFSGNQVRDLVKVVLVELLSNPRSLELTQQGGGALGDLGGLMDLILLERNRVALEKLDEVVEIGPEARIVLLYGAAHMPGLAEGLHERGYQQAGETVWLPAIEVDLAASNVDPRTLELVRRRINASLGEGKRESRPIEDGDEP